MNRDLQPVVTAVERQLGLSCDGARAEVIAETIGEAMAAADLRDAAAFARRLEVDATQRAALAEALRVPETYFLREPEQLDELARRVLPALVGERLPGHRFRVWSAGCASGEEAYSLAITLEAAGLAPRTDILATDRSSAAVRTARRGRYRAWSLRAMDEADRRRHLSGPAEDGSLRIADRLRRTVRFEQHDLVADPYPVGFDLIVCRNVLLYLTPAAGAAVVERLARSLAPGGWLALGAADPHHHAAGLLHLVRTGAGAMYRAPSAAETVPAVGPANRRVRPPRRSTRAPRSPVGCAPAEDRPPPPPTPAPADPPVDDALARCEVALRETPLEPILHCRHATLLLEAGRADRALQAATGAAFLDPNLAAAQLLLGRAQLASGAPALAAKAFGRALALLEGEPASALVPGADEPAGRLLEVARAGEQRALAWDRT